MDRKKANIILRIFMGLWICLGLVILIICLCNGGCLSSNLKYLIQLIVALFCSVWLGAHIWKNTK